jgi:hypothetical protein
MKCYYHPQEGYWETITDPSEEVIASYPAGTLETYQRPSPQHQLIDDVWVFVEKTPEQIEEDLRVWRETVALSKGQFCINAYNAGFLSEEDAVTAAKGDWPESFTTALSGLTPSQIVEAKIEWALVTTVRRNAPLLEMVRASQDISEEALDALFGLTE